MQLSISREQYAALVDLLYLADWMLHAHEVEDTPNTAPYRAIIRSILAHAGEMQAHELVDRIDGEPVPSRVVEDRMQPFIEAYDDQTMWDELSFALGRRDAERALGEDALREMPANERVEALLKHEEFWENEFHRHGLERIGVSDPELSLPPDRSP
jgi:hypothetical protein